MFVKCVDADSVEVLIVASELVDVLITTILGTDELLEFLLVGVQSFPVLADLKYRRLNAVVGVALEEAIMESVSELLEVYGLVGRVIVNAIVDFAMAEIVFVGCDLVTLTVKAVDKE